MELSQPVTLILEAAARRPSPAIFAFGLLANSRHNDIHDTLAPLNEMIALDILRGVKGGSGLPVEPLGAELFDDWECRRNDDE